MPLSPGKRRAGLEHARRDQQAPCEMGRESYLEEVMCESRAQPRLTRRRALSQTVRSPRKDLESGEDKPYLKTVGGRDRGDSGKGRG